METNNIFTESYDDPIIDESSTNEIDILSTGDDTTVDYDEIPDYSEVSDDDNTRTVTLKRFCEEFTRKLVNTLNNSKYSTSLYFINESGVETDILTIEKEGNLLDFAIWDNKYITTNNIPYDVDNRLMSFNVINQYLKFKINLIEYIPSSIYSDDDVFQTKAIAQPNIIKGETDINNFKIISIRDFAEFTELINYFTDIICDIDNECVEEWVCDPEDPDCNPHESY